MAFLSNAKVPGIESPACQCGWRWQDTKHAVLPTLAAVQRGVKCFVDAGTNDFLMLFSTYTGLGARKVIYRLVC